jgi:hypothetical protein
MTLTIRTFLTGLMIIATERVGSWQLKCVRSPSFFASYKRWASREPSIGGYSRKFGWGASEQNYCS